MIKVKFCGAARTVTGSCYLVETSTAKFLVDCGMFQGPEVEARNLEDFEFDPSTIDFVLLTHAHIDHSGMLPKLVKHGFTGPIYATSHTVQIATELLLDSAKIQEENFKRGEFFGKYTRVKVLLLDGRDAEKTISQMKTVNYKEESEGTENIFVKFFRVGHILGAASAEVTIDEDGKKTKLLFSGDIGRTEKSIVDSFESEDKAEPNYVFMESLYGGEEHPSRSEAIQDLIKVINQTINNGGNVYIPVFAVERTQEILNDLRIAKGTGTLSENLPVWLDSPLAQRVTRIYTESLQHSEKNLFDFQGLKYVTNHKKSVKLGKTKGQVIMAGSGMADGGRILNHLATGLENKKNSIVFVGYQAEGTLGRELVEGAKRVLVGETLTNVKAKIYYLQGFSAHGDTKDYLNWLEKFISPALSRVFLVHAEGERFDAMEKILKEKGIKDIYVPEWNETVEPGS